MTVSAEAAVRLLVAIRTLGGDVQRHDADPGVRWFIPDSAEATGAELGPLIIRHAPEIRAVLAAEAQLLAIHRAGGRWRAMTGGWLAVVPSRELRGREEVLFLERQHGAATRPYLVALMDARDEGAPVVGCGGPGK